MSSFKRVTLTTFQSYTYWVNWGIAVVCSEPVVTVEEIHAYKKNLNKRTCQQDKQMLPPCKAASWMRALLSQQRWDLDFSHVDPHLPCEIYLPKCLRIGGICLPKVTKAIIPVSILYYDFNFLSSFTFQLTCSWYPKEPIWMKWRCGQNGLACEF